MADAIAAAHASTELEVVTPALPDIALDEQQVAFIETEELGRLHVGALAGSAPTAHKLVAVLRRRVPAVRPVIVCANPLPTRVLRPE